MEKERRGPARKEARVSSKRLEAGRESDEAVGAVVQHATAPSESEMRDEAMGAVAQMPRHWQL